ncbi:MAG: YfhO family protein, partial [Alistipes sp.]|nr:YfhO family protein [Alistipes sp.]
YGLRGAAQQLPTYWGEQPYTGGPTYLGAAAVFLAVLGVALLRGRNKWWLVAVCGVMLFLAWGHNWLWFTRLFFDYLPGYDKFRTVSMTLVVVQWAVPVLGAWGLMRLWRDEVPCDRLRRALAWAAGLTGGLCLLFAVAGGALFDFGEQADAAMMTDQFSRIFAANNLQSYIDKGVDIEWGETTAAAMAADRAAMMQTDAWRSLLMIALAAGAVALFAWRRIGRGVLVTALGAVMLLDLVPVDRRFVSSDDFVSPRRRRIAMTEADRLILDDPTLGFRVFNLTVSPFNDATTSYFHRSVGGYHGAKLARYQDLIDRYLSRMDEGVLDMLNTRYAIVPADDGTPQAVLRGTEFGAAWFVDRAVEAATPQQEIDLLGEVDLRTTAVVAASDAEAVAVLSDANTTGIRDLPEPIRSIRLEEYRPNYLRYAYSTPEAGVVVFSEIFYDKGWKAYVDGVEAPYFRADYVLRAMLLPAGRHTVEWRFRAPAWGVVETVTGIASVLILLFALGAAVVWIRARIRRA